ncbi:MAG: zinc dependent phospholipase C family protein [Christensenellales bacterium]|jgi:hypothetical protein
MATWIAHMRVAEYFMNNFHELNNEAFLVGNIGPDCGVPNEDRSAYVPDSEITHWKNEGGAIDAAAFKEAHLQARDSKYPFYLGYYLHLLTDLEWAKLYSRKKLEPLYKDGLAEGNSFVRKIKKDWYGQDHLYLFQNKDCVFFNMFAKIDAFDNIYLDYYAKDALIKQVKNISKFYLNHKEDQSRAFPYLSKEEMDAFVEDCISSVKTDEVFSGGH